MFNFIDTIGYIGGILGSIRLFPQIIKSIRTKATKDISYGMLSLSITSQICMIIYSSHIKAMPILIPVCVSCSFTFIMISVKYVFDKRESYFQTNPNYIKLEPLDTFDESVLT